MSLKERLVFVLATAFLLVQVFKPSSSSSSSAVPRQLTVSSTPDREFALPASAEWCRAPTLDPLPYHQCGKKNVLNEVRLRPGSGMGSSLYGVLDVAMWSFAGDVCFYVNERETRLRDQSITNSSFLQRYFEPIGLLHDSEEVQQAIANPNIVKTDMYYDHRAVQFGVAARKHIEPLGYINMGRYELRKIMFRRMLRFREEQREKACEALEAHSLAEDFMTFSVRRGDKKKETQVQGTSHFPEAEEYIAVAEREIEKHFGGVVPAVFIATDDCTVIEEFEAARPDWRFESECKKVHATGYDLGEMDGWTQAQLDEHFEKFFVELIAMATAKVFIGVGYTNVAFLAYWMRQQEDDTFLLLDGEVTTRIP